MGYLNFVEGLQRNIVPLTIPPRFSFGLRGYFHLAQNLSLLRVILMSYYHAYLIFSMATMAFIGLLEISFNPTTFIYALIISSNIFLLEEQDG